MGPVAATVITSLKDWVGMMGTSTPLRRGLGGKVHGIEGAVQVVLQGK